MIDYDYYNDRNEKLDKAYKSCLFSLIGMLVGVILAMLCSCTTTRYIPVETVRTEKVEVHDTVMVKDSTAHSDSTYTSTQMLLQKVDSAYLAMLGVINAPKEAWLLQSNTNTYHSSKDTTEHQEKEVSNNDSVRTEYIQTPYPVEKKLTRWQQIKIDWGGKAIVAFTVLFFILVWLIVKRIKLQR